LRYTLEISSAAVRFEPTKVVSEERAEIDREDIKAILKSTRVNLKVLRKRARAESISEMLEDLIRK